MTAQPYKEVPIAEQLTATSTDLIQDSDAHQPPVMGLPLDPDPYDYPWIRAWHTYLQHPEEIINARVLYAQRTHADHFACELVSDGEDWITLWDIYNPEVRQYYLTFAEQNHLHVPADVLAAWLDPTPPPPTFARR